VVRRVRNPGSGKPPHNGPAKGAGVGGPASGIPAGGDGWGGPAKGAQPPHGPQPFGPDNPALPRHRTPEEVATRKAVLAARVENYLDMLDGIACDEAKEDTVRMAAMEKAANRIEGTPIQRQVTATVEPSAILDTRPPVEDFLTEFRKEDESHITH